MDAGEVVFLTVPTMGEANERGNEVLLEQNTLDLFEALIENTPLPGEEPGPADGSVSGVEAGSETSQQAAAPVPAPAT